MLQGLCRLLCRILRRSKAVECYRDTHECKFENREILRRNALRGDSPIHEPVQDAFGFDPFAKAIAKSIYCSDAAEGIVFSINGGWGAGKSSVVNLVLFHIGIMDIDKRINIITFNPWWFTGVEVLTASFFQELRATVGRSLGENARRSIANIGTRLSLAAPLLGGFAALSGTPEASIVMAEGARALGRSVQLDKSIDEERQELVQALASQRKKYIVVLDDIDRLSTDDALQLFKLIKTVGKLPNIIYLLSFDRELAEKLVATRFPAEGASYLEKIIQGVFDVPSPDRDDLRNQLVAEISEIMELPSGDKSIRFGNIFYEVVSPFLKIPRDVVRLSNAIKTTWPAVVDEVDRADFIAIETLRLFVPGVYYAIRTHEEMLTDVQQEHEHDKESLANEYDAVFLAGLPHRQREIVKRALRRLFPRLDAIWANVWSSGLKDWQRDRRICSSGSFRTYFAFAVTNDGITSQESQAAVNNAGNKGETAKYLLKMLSESRRRGGTRAALALEDLNLRACDIEEDAVLPFLKDIFSIADVLNIEADSRKGFYGLASNEMRIHWLLNSLLIDRFDISMRSRIIMRASYDASLEWLISLSGRCKNFKNKKAIGDDHDIEPLVDDETAESLYDYSLTRIRAAAEDGDLARMPRLDGILYRWCDRAGCDEVKAWTDIQLANDEFVIALARDVVSEMWSHAMEGFGSLGDRVAKKTNYVNFNPLKSLLDIDRFKERVTALLECSRIREESRTLLEEFRKTPEYDPASSFKGYHD